METNECSRSICRIGFVFGVLIFGALVLGPPLAMAGPSSAKTANTITQTAEAAASQNTGGLPTPIGMSLSPLTPEARAQLGIPATVNGAVVSQVTQNSNAAQSGIQTGDIIVRVGNTDITTPDQAIQEISKAAERKQEAVPLMVAHKGGATSYVVVFLGTN